MAAGGHAANEHARVVRVLLHAQPITEHRPAGKWARRIDRNDADGFPVTPELGQQAIDKRALAGAGRTGDADEVGTPGATEDLSDQGGAGGIVVFDQGNGACDSARIAGQDAIAQAGRHRARSCRAMTRRWISLVPSPMVVSLTSRKYFSAG